MNWNTKKVQQFQSFGCGQTHDVLFVGTCESCGRKVYSHECKGDRHCGDFATDSPDPRGVIPANHCLYRYHAAEQGYSGRDIISCAHCADDGNKYRSMVNAAQSTGT